MSVFSPIGLVYGFKVLRNTYSWLGFIVVFWFTVEGGNSASKLLFWWNWTQQIRSTVQVISAGLSIVYFRPKPICHRNCLISAWSCIIGGQKLCLLFSTSCILRFVFLLQFQLLFCSLIFLKYMLHTIYVTLIILIPLIFKHCKKFSPFSLSCSYTWILFMQLYSFDHHWSI